MNSYTEKCFISIGVLTEETGTDELQKPHLHEKCHPCMRNRFCEIADLLYFVQYFVGKL